ncbi:ATP-binding protein [Cupriavidus taiwanensis]|uniref:ATP-binding protein n=1 Tax=Cupriavidus taiwanensis TaxID=164546 RepID=UPI0018DC64DE|nr:ATP-binding protein [Cupriavidus taiwanensis]
MSKATEKYGEEVVYCDAIYTPSPYPQHRGNPLVEALPAFYNGTEPIEGFANYPPVGDAERRESHSYRLLAVSRLRTLIEVMPWHLGVMRDIYSTIWRGYEFRNPVATRKEIVQRRYEKAKEDNGIFPMKDPAPTHSSNIGLFGASGVGKSTAVSRCLDFLPQVIRHPDYGFTQLVWLKVECPPNGSLSELMKWILEAVDEVLDTQYASRIKERTTLPARMSIVGKVLEEHFTGFLVIDEVQNVLADAKSRNRNIDFFMTFVNKIHVPSMHIGLATALELYPENIHSRRRAADGGIRLLDPQLSEEEWSDYIDELSRYQWTRRLASRDVLDKGLKEHSQRNICIANRLYELAQAMAIESDVESLTYAFIRKVARTRFSLVKPFVDAIQRKDEEAIAENSAAVEKLSDDVREDVQNAIDRATIQKLVAKKSAHEVISKATANLISLGMPQDHVVRQLKRLAEQNPGCDAIFLVAKYLERRRADDVQRRGNLEKQVAEELFREHESLNGRGKN